MKRLGLLKVWILAALLQVVVAIPANATTLTFEGLTVNPAEDITTANQGYGGLLWNTGNNWALFNASAFPTPALSGSYGVVNNFGITPNFMTANGTPFNFGGAWVIGWFFNAPAAIGIRGFDAGNVLVGDTGLVGINTSTYTHFSASWNNLTRLEFYGGQFFALDDIDITPGATAVPEPGTLVLLGTGLAAVAARRRLKKRA